MGEVVQEPRRASGVVLRKEDTMPAKSYTVNIANESAAALSELTDRKSVV